MKLSLSVFVRLFALFSVVMIAGPLAGCGGQDEAPTPTPILATPVPATATTAASAPGEAAYRDKVASWGVRMGVALNKFQTLDTNPDPSSTDWQNSVVSTISSVETMSAEPRTWDTPPRFGGVQEKILSAAWHYDKGMTLYTQGITNVDAATIQSGRDELTKGNADIQDASKLIDALQP